MILPAIHPSVHPSIHPQAKSTENLFMTLELGLEDTI